MASARHRARVDGRRAVPALRRAIAFAALRAARRQHGRRWRALTPSVASYRPAQGHAKLDAAAFESAAALLVCFVSLLVAQGCYGVTAAALKQKDAVSCVLCDAKPLDDAQRGCEMRAHAQRVFWSRAKAESKGTARRRAVPVSCGRIQPARRAVATSGRQLTTIARTTAQWH